jgi:hypothetical protein
MARVAKVSIKKAEQTKQADEVEIPDIETQIVPIHIVGISPLIVNNFSEKQKEDIKDKPMPGGAVPKRAQRPPRDPEAEYQRARILDVHGKDCIPVRWFKASLVTAAGLTDKMISMKMVKATVFVLGDTTPIVGSPVRMREDTVRVGKWPNKQPMARYRPCFDEWALSFRIQFEPRVISLPQLIYLVRRAGLNVGLCEWRPEKSGEFGRFDLKMAPTK